MTDLTVSNDTAWSTTAKTRMGVVLAIWFALAALAGVTGAVAAGPDSLFRPIALTMVVPVLAFVALYLGSTRFRDFVLGRDLRFVTLLQAWRVVGFAFLPLYATATLASGAIPALAAGGVTSAPMEVWPLMLFPSFGVPLFAFAHLTALFQVRALRRA